MIHFGRPFIDEEEKNKVLEVLDGPILTHGPVCKEFEKKFEIFMGGGHAVTTSSCMASLHLGAIAFDLKAGDEVIVPAQTHVATVHAVELLGATPVFVDCELITGNIDITKIEKGLTKNTKGIIIVHFGGIPVNMKDLVELAQKNDLFLIEDCALALGSKIDNKHVGLWGDLGTFSFYPVKHITTGEGGMLVSKNEKIAQFCSKFRAFNVDRKFDERVLPGNYDVTGVGLNYRMSEIGAALGCSQMEKLDLILSRRKRNFYELKGLLEKVPDIRILDSDQKNLESSHYCLVVLLKGKYRGKRDRIILELKSREVGTSIYYPKPVPAMDYYKKKYNSNPVHYQNAAEISSHSIAFPVGPHLSVRDMVKLFESLCEVLEEL